MAGQNLDTSAANINFQRYCSCLLEVAAREMCRVFLYLYHDHQPDPKIYVGEVLKTIPNGFARIGPIGQLALHNHESPTIMDISLLYVLLQRTCGLRPDTQQNSVWNSPSSEADGDALEHQLYLLKEIRNDFAHKTHKYKTLTKQQLKEEVDVLERLCCNIVTKAAHRIGRSPNTVAITTARIRSQMHAILTSSQPPDLHPKEWAIMAHEEQQAVLPKHQEFFAQVQVVMPRTSVTGSYTNDLLHVLSWRCSDGSQPQLILLRGPAGVGKTAFCNQIWKSWVSRESAENSECDLVLKVECGQVTTRDVGRLVQEELLPRASQHCDPGQVVNLLDSLRVVWLLDGLEEPAPEAIHLLREILRKFSNKHLVMVACQHSDVSEVLRMADDIRVCEARLEGLSGRGAHSLIRHLLQDQDELYDKFIDDAKVLNVEILRELINPLKLKLAVTLWQEGTLDFGNEASLPHLYSAVEAAQVAKVSVRLADKWCYTTREARDRVQAWLKELYGVAFEMMAKNQLVILDQCSIEILEEKARLLLSSYSDCFSVFLASQQGGVSSENAFRFIHLTQQCYFAAQHVYHQLLSQPSPAKTLTQMLKLDLENVDRTCYDRFYDMLLIVFSILVTKSKLTEELKEVLVSALSRCRRCDWFEVVHRTGYSESLAKLVGQHMPDAWQVTDTCLRAATLLLKYTTPSLLSLTIICNPNSLQQHLTPFLEEVALADTTVHLLFLYCLTYGGNDTYCDKYLEVISHPESNCVIAKFYGTLTADGCIRFLQNSHITSVGINVSDIITLQTLMMISKTAENLQELSLHLLLTDIKQCMNISARKNIILDIYLHMAEDVHLKKMTKLLSKMSKQYRKIILFNVSGKAALEFSKKLALSGVRVEELTRGMIVRFEESGTEHMQWTSYGSVPIAFPDRDFKHLWEDPPCFAITVSGNNLCINVT